MWQVIIARTCFYSLDVTMQSSKGTRWYAGDHRLLVTTIRELSCDSDLQKITFEVWKISIAGAAMNETYQKQNSSNFFQ